MSACKQWHKRLQLCDILAIPKESTALFSLTTEAAQAIIKRQIKIIKEQWEPICDEVDLQDTERRLLWKQQTFNPFSVEGFEQLIAD